MNCKTYVFPVQIAHSHIAVKFSQSENSSLLFLYFKKAMEFFNFFCSLSLGYKYSITKIFSFVKLLIKALLQLLSLSNSCYIFIKAYFLKLVKYYFYISNGSLTALVLYTKCLIVLHRLVIQLGHGR